MFVSDLLVLTAMYLGGISPMLLEKARKGRTVNPDSTGKPQFWSPHSSYSPEFSPEVANWLQAGYMQHADGFPLLQRWPTQLFLGS